MTVQQYQSVLEFWFGKYASDKNVVENMASLWWSKIDDKDQLIRDRFGTLYGSLIQGELQIWKQLQDSRLAMIILADQFSRNMFRGLPESFTLDPLALSLTIEGIELGMDQQLRWPQRIFFYMPLEHSESLKMQEMSLKHYRELTKIVPGDEQDMVYGYVNFAIRHWQIIERFGRFPHRNEILGRESSNAELEFLEQPGSSF